MAKTGQRRQPPGLPESAAWHHDDVARIDQGIRIAAALDARTVEDQRFLVVTNHDHFRTLGIIGVATRGRNGLQQGNFARQGVAAFALDLAPYKIFIFLGHNGIFASLPYRILPALQVPVYAEMKERDKDLYDRLEKAGFMLDFGEDDSGLFCKYLRRGSGYYIDVGASELIANGDIKLKTGQTECITETGVMLADGTEIPADVIVLATGYGSMNGWAAQLISQDVADKVGKCWGMGSDTTKDPGPWEGELRNMWKPTQQPGLWFHGGNLHQSRHYSSYLSLQLKARMENIPTPVYGLQEVYHTS